MHVALFGVGTTGSHAARQLIQLPLTQLTLVDPDQRRLRRVATAIRDVVADEIAVRAVPDGPVGSPDVVVLAGPRGTHVAPARSWLQGGSHVVSIGDDADDVAGLLALDPVAVGADRCLAVGAGFVPGLSCVLARYAACQLDSVEVISVYKAGTGGPACARQHHRALKGSGQEWIDGAWMFRRGGSGRELAWFPDPFGARDCYRAALPGPMLLQPVFPDAQRISSRMAATRRDRFTSWLPMLRRPHDDGGPGAVRVEVRGHLGRSIETVIVGVMDHPSVATGTVAAVVAAEAVAGRAPVGAHGLAAWPEPGPILTELHRRGVRVASFSGHLAPTS
jgi:saccharopine dehydrogenase-like NADP-dependent oxidoreductase